MSTASSPPLGLLQQLGKLLSVLKYSLVFSTLVVILPLSGIEGVALDSMTGNLFVELSRFGVFWASLFLLATAWSVMLTTGLVVNGVTQRWSSTASSYRSHAALIAAPSGQIPEWAELLFSAPVTTPQLVYFAALAVPGLAVIVRYAVRYTEQGAERDGFVTITAAGAAVAGVVAAYLVLLIVCAPAALLDPGDPPLRDPIALRVWRLAPRLPFLARAMRGLQARLSKAAAWLGLRYVLDPISNRLYPAHFFAFTVAVLLGLLYVGFALVFRPENGLRAAPVVHLWMSLLLFIWVFGGFEFHLARLRVSPLVVVLIVAVLGYAVFSIDHRYCVEPGPRPNGVGASGADRHCPSRPPSAPTAELTPLVVASHADANLVVIASAGGGISAAVWTTLGLERLIDERAQIQKADLRREIRLLSTISGGSVGAAYYLDGLIRQPATPLDEIRQKSGASSLDAVAYGLAYRDLPGFLTGGLATLLPGRDRAELLERAWIRTAEGRIRGASPQRGAYAKPQTLVSLRSTIAEGRLPGFIFGTTVMESGRRLMVTPMTFPEFLGSGGTPVGVVAATAPVTGPRPRALTLSEYLPDGPHDMDLWTAARLSATFSFVSPAARSSLADREATRKTDAGRRPLWHHLIDGGYYDNFGVTSALDWLTPVLIARAEGNPRLRFTRVAIVELRAFRREPPEYARPTSGSIAAVAGPAIGLAAIRSGAAAERDDIDVGRFVSAWTALFRSLKMPVCLGSFVFEPDANQPSPPLSWQLSSVQLKRLMAAWPAPELQDRSISGSLGWTTRELLNFLDGRCAGELR